MGQDSTNYLRPGFEAAQRLCHTVRFASYEPGSGDREECPKLLTAVLADRLLEIWMPESATLPRL